MAKIIKGEHWYSTTVKKGRRFGVASVQKNIRHTDLKSTMALDEWTCTGSNRAYMKINVDGIADGGAVYPYAYVYGDHV